ncbi:MAG: MFS transporter [Desulfobulbaceae bacterium]|nr:MFS transporter [Desulfobulbaceae bacterium]
MASCPPLHKNYSVNNFRSYFALLSHNQQYRLLWISTVISQLGNWFNYIAISVLLTHLTGTGHAVSWFLIAKFVPPTILGPIAGVVADRFSKKNILIYCDVARIFVVLGFLFVNSAGKVWLAYTLALIQESIWTFYDPAKYASIPKLCREEQINIANALNGVTWSIMLSIGAALGGLATTLWGWKTAIILDSVSFLCSALLTKKIILQQTEAQQRNQGSLTAYLGMVDIIAGWHYIKNNRPVAVILAVKSGWALTGGVLVMLTIFGEQVLVSGMGNGWGSGILYSFRGIGAAIGPILAWRLLGETNHAMHRGIAIAFFTAAISYMLLSGAENFSAAVFFVLIGNIGGATQWVFSTTLLQKVVSEGFLGRVVATEMIFYSFSLCLSTYLTGLAIDEGVEPRLVMLILGALFCAPGLAWLSFTSFGRYKIAHSSSPNL